MDFETNQFKLSESLSERLFFFLVNVLCVLLQYKIKLLGVNAFSMIKDLTEVKDKCSLQSLLFII